MIKKSKRWLQLLAAATAYQVFDHSILLKICGRVQNNKQALTAFLFCEGAGWEGVDMVLNSEVKQNVSSSCFGKLN